MPAGFRLAATMASLALLSACVDHPVAVDLAPPAVPVHLVELRCRADLSSLSCESASADATGGSRNLVTVGGQNHYVRLVSSGTFFTAADSTLHSTVTVQNLLLTAMGTADGTTPHADGVRVFFPGEPSNGVTLTYPDGVSTFTASGQEFIQYGGGALGPDEMLSPDETSLGIPWVFTLNGATSFTFSVYVNAQVPGFFSAHFTEVSGGGTHSCAVNAEGKAYCWGNDANGQLGNGSALTSARGVPSPVQMPAGITFSGLALGMGHSCALGSDNQAYCWGNDASSQLGNGSGLGSMTIPAPVVVPPGVVFTSITAGNSHGCGLTAAGRAYCWGSDTFGQLGNGAAGGQVSAAAVDMPAGVTFSGLVAGAFSSCALGSDGEAYCWGYDAYGQLGNGGTLTDNQASPSPVDTPAGVTFTAISAGNRHACALGSDALAYCWGADDVGQLGNGSALSDTQASPSAVAAPAGITFSSIVTGQDHVCALSAGNPAYCWGTDIQGELGNGPTESANQTSPVPVQTPSSAFTSLAAGKSHTCALTATSSHCWGYGGLRLLGDGTAANRSAPVIVAGTR